MIRKARLPSLRVPARLARLLVAGALALAAASVGLMPIAGPQIAAAQVANSTPAGALPLAGTVTDSLAGANGGDFRYYKFTYPGDQSKATVAITATPNDPAVLQYVGFKIYGPDAGREYAKGEALKDIVPSATADLVNSQPGEYVVQVYNYVPNTETVVSFSLTLSGIPLPKPLAPVGAPAAPAPAPVAPPPAAPAPAAAPAQPTGDPTSPQAAPRITGAVNASLAGQPGGRFHFYKFVHPGDGSSVTINLNATPNDQNILQYVGFKLYGPDVGREYLSVNAAKDNNPSATGSLVLNQPGEYVIQVYNYVPNVDSVVTYMLQVVGLPAQPAPATAPAPAVAPAPVAPAPAVPAPAVPAPAAPAAPGAPIDNSSPDRAVAVTGTATGSLAGQAGGRFLYYKFNYPGDQRTVTINLTATPNDGAVLQYVGFKVYGPDAGREYAAANATKDANPSASTTLSNQQPGVYTIQVYNYVPNADTVVSFTISLSGL